MKKRSSYRPKGMRFDNLAWVLAGFKKVAEMDDNIVVRTGNHSAMRTLVEGKGTKEEVKVVINALNVTEALADVRSDLGADWRQEIHAAIDALVAMARRGEETGRFVFRGPELTAINLAMEIHDAQLDQATVNEVAQAYKLIDKNMRSGKVIRVVEKTK